MTIDELLDSYEIFAMSDVEKGERFERLMKNFLLTYPVWRGKIADVWRWKDFPYRDELGGKDLGIDIVCKTVDGDFWAAQCKFYAESTVISKAAVDSFFSNATRTFGGGKNFSTLVWISTSNRYTDNAREMFKGRSHEVKIIDLEFLRRAQVNWALLDNGFIKDDAVIVRKLRDYQLEAIDKARKHYVANTRGKLIMACGTGKTFTALKIAENLAPDGKILFLVPSISLLRQTLEEWATFSVKPINAVCVCSDSTASSLDDDIVEVNLPLPAMTDADKISYAVKNLRGDGLTVIFSTYQSIEVVHKLNLNFDLIICDEAHRTTGSSKDLATQFTAVHDENFIHAQRRLYMTATPRMFTSDAKTKAAINDITLWSMDDKEIYGKEFYRLDFNDAVEKNLLTDYKVIVLTVNETVSSEKKSDADAKAKIDGCINALSKKMISVSKNLVEVDPSPMHTAVAFCPKITDSVKIAEMFNNVAGEKKNLFKVAAEHVDGKMSGGLRSKKLSWLKNTSTDGNSCHILTNVRCLSEGIDVPALDAVIFMSSKKSKVEIVQAVGRVMRRAKDKKYGYIIIPVVVPLEKNPEDILSTSKTYGVIWEVLNALRAHDNRVDIFIEDIKLQLARGEKPGLDSDDDGHIFIGGAEDEDELEETYQTALNFGVWEDFLYARMVEHVGNRKYWEQWAEDIADIAKRHTDRINDLISVEGEPRREFYNFVYNLQQNLNPAVTPAEAVDLLAQHIVTRPVFNAIFENYAFANINPVSQSLEKILNVFDTHDTDDESEQLQKFFDSVRKRCAAAKTAEDKQTIIIELYEKFFATALKKTAEKLGIVYTPVEVVDFILRSVDAVLKKYFNRGLSDKNIHVLDPFAGTGTFLVRLIQSGLIRQKDLRRKYLHELHANEIVLLAYYIAAVNIENAFFEVNRLLGQEVNSTNNLPTTNLPTTNLLTYQPFNGICFTDTFELYERGQGDLPINGVMKENSARVNLQKQTRIEVIVGNPPYSVGQTSANDNNQNQTYSKLEDRIAATYAAKTNATLKRALYDSYIKAFCWASDRISDGGVIGFVTNAGWLDGSAMDGLRKCFAKEFSAIYIFNLRGDQRTQGDTSKREGGKIFGSGSRAPIAITILVKTPDFDGKAEIFYRDIGDYLTRDEKLDIINRTPDVFDETFAPIIPNDKGDWINQRGNEFETFIPLHEVKNIKYEIFYMTRSNGLKTNRDVWCYNFSRSELEKNIRTTIDFYNSHEPTDFDPKKFVWTRGAVQNKNRGLKIEFDAAKIVETCYRPFCKSNLYYDRALNEVVGTISKFFPTGHENNLLICVNGIGDKDFSVFITNRITDVQFQFNGQCYPLYYYERGAQIDLFGENLTRRDGISDWILNRARSKLSGVSCQLSGENDNSSLKAESSKLKADNQITKKDIFYYVYGFLHLPSYREKFSAELKKSLPRIILVDDAEKFWHLSRAGRELAEIHLNYESQPPAQVEIIGCGDFRVKKMRLSKDKTTLTYNEHITIKNIPPRSFEYVVNGRSPLEWIIDRYQVKTDKSSGIVNDANDWGIEHDNPRYILDLILSSITVSLKTLDIVDNLPAVDF